jgi:hypothetical protein
VPDGGTTGQVLTKLSDTDGDAEWQTLIGQGWEVLVEWDHAVEGTINSLEVNTTDYEEFMVICSAVTTSVAAWRVLQFSVNGGTSYFGAVGDYELIAATGTVSTESAAFLHGTSSALARTSYAHIPRLQALPRRAIVIPQRGLLVFPANSADPINRIRFSALTANATPTGANLTGGRVVMLGRKGSGGGGGGGTAGLDLESVRDTIGDTLVAGDGITIDVDDAENTVTISAVAGGGALPLSTGGSPLALMDDMSGQVIGVPLGMPSNPPLKMSSYLLRGTLASRPASPPSAENTSVLYFATNTLELFAWSGSAWSQVGV